MSLTKRWMRNVEENTILNEIEQELRDQEEQEYYDNLMLVELEERGLL